MTRLTLEQFKNLVQEETYHSEMDALCLTWLKQATKDFSLNGEVAKKLLEIVEGLMQ